jgi:hypothetical protein
MCGECGTYTDVVVLPINGRCRTIDRCIHHIVAALNAGGVETVASCCGHGKKPGRIDLADGRVLMIMTEAKANACEQRSGEK